MMGDENNTVMTITEQMLDELRAALRDTMSEKRYAHTLGVERMAKRLGELYCPDKIALLRAAALLHDITKEETFEKQLQLCEQFGIIVDELDRMAPKTFHAKTAAALIPVKYPEFADPIVIGAVRWHTTGRAEMTLYEHLIYLADYIDDTRKFEDCVKLRDMFWNPAPACMGEKERMRHLLRILIASYDFTISGLLEEGAPISADTFHARNQLLLRLKKET
ncbi:MAG: bis(5'-nucleosyl)-tetraphosphatase (symmetrical) YqeK [Clostridia bacterium]|nr:bis(5'-nucleosyl)-tetraphosphatase (symmetrical) YqeK [Clostridia bacterium]